MRVVGNFGLTSDEFSFLAVLFVGLITVAAPLYIASFFQGRRGKRVVHEVTHNGGIDHDQPTLKDYSHAAYQAAWRSEIISEEARRVATAVEVRLDEHLDQSKEQGDAILERIDKIETATQAETRREEKP